MFEGLQKVVFRGPRCRISLHISIATGREEEAGGGGGRREEEEEDEDEEEEE